MLLSGVFSEAAQHSRSVTLKPYPEEERNDTWPVTLGALEEAEYTVNILDFQVYDSKTNVLISSSAQKPDGPPHFLWEKLEKSRTHYKFRVVNSSLKPGETTIRVDCAWAVKGGGGGGGGEPIRGWAVGHAKVTNDGPFFVDAAMNASGIGTTNIFTSSSAGDEPVESDWSIESGEAEFVGESQSKSSVKVKSMVPGNVTVRGTYCR